MNTNFPWPDEREDYRRVFVKHDFGFHQDPERLKSLYERALRKEFGGLRIQILQSEEVERQILAPRKKRDETVEERGTVPTRRFLLKIEHDSYPKIPDPVLRWWHKLWLNLRGEPYPKTPEPPRITMFYDMTPIQFAVFTSIYKELG